MTNEACLFEHFWLSCFRLEMAVVLKHLKTCVWNMSSWTAEHVVCCSTVFMQFFFMGEDVSVTQIQ